MPEIDKHTEVLEDFEALVEARHALYGGNQPRFEAIVREIEQELRAEYCTQLPAKIRRWVESSVVLQFFDRGPARFYVQAKMLYRDGFYEATIMLCRSTAEMICYDRLDGMSHPFGSVQEVEKCSFRKLLNWLHQNDPRIDAPSFKNLNDLYDIGNNYIHPKSGQMPSADSIKSLHLLGESVFAIYGVKGIEELIGRKVRSVYLEFPDIASGQNFIPTVFASPDAAVKHANRHESK